MKTYLKKVVSLVLIFVVCTGVLSGCTDSTLPLKSAFFAESNALSYIATTNIAFEVDDRILDRTESSFADIFSYAENSSIKLVNKVYIEPGRQKGLISTDVDYKFAANSKDVDHTFSFHIDTSFDITDITKNKPSMKLTQYYSIKSVPKWLSERLPNKGTDKYFVLPLSNNEQIKDYIIKCIGKKTPNIQNMLATLSWTRLNDKSFKINLSDSDVKSTLDLILNTTLLSPLDEQNQRRWDSAFEAINFKNTMLKYDIENNKFKSKSWVFDLSFDYFKLMNNILGNPTGRQVKVPLKVYMDTTYTSWNEVEKFSFPVAFGNDVPFSQVPIKDILPKFRDLPELYTEDKIIVNIDGKKVDFLASIPPIIYNDRILLPLKYMFETQGVSIIPRETDGILQASAMVGIKSVTVTKDSNLATIMGQTIELPAPVGIAYDTFYMPIKLFAESFDMQEPTSEVKLLPDGSNQFIINFVKSE